MKLSKIEVFVLTTFLDDIRLKNEGIKIDTMLNEQGIEVLSKLQSKLASKIINIDPKAVYNIILEQFSEKLNRIED